MYRSRWPLALLAALAIGACGSDEGPAAPGGRNGVLLSYVTPRLQIVPAEEARTVALAIEVRREAPDAGTEPWPGAQLRVARTRGRGALSSTTITTDERGIARVGLTTPGAIDKTAVVVSLASDSDSFLPFDVVSAPVVEIALAPGEVAHVDAPSDGALLRLVGDDTARWLLVPHQTDFERGGTPYRIFHQTATSGAGAAAFGAEPLAEPYLAATAASPDPAGDVIYGAIDPGPLTPSAAVPSRVSVRSCRISTDGEAVLRYHGRRVAIYVHADPGLHQARIDSLGAAFDDRIEPTNSRLFGPMTDLDRNGVVLAIFSPDMEGVGGAYCDSVRRLEVEAFYVKWQPSSPIEGMLALMAHEHQHVINAGHHFRFPQEVLWLNEAMSLAAEAANEAWGTVLPRVWRFLNGQNGGLTMLPLEYDRAFDDAYMMFLVYLGDRFGPDFFRRLGDSRLYGIANLESRTGLPIEELLRDWFVTVGVVGRGVVDDPRYTYRTLPLPGLEAEIARCRCVPVSRLESLQLEPLLLGSGFDAFRTLNRADADYYELIAPASQAGGWDVYFDAYGRPSLKLSVVRIR